MLSAHELAFAVIKRYPDLIHGRDFWAMHPLASDGSTQAAEAEIVEWRSRIPQPSIEDCRETFKHHQAEWQEIEIKRERAAKLAASDWSQLADTPTTIREPWATYRQRLRDLPKQVGFPHTIDWPTPPQESTR